VRTENDLNVCQLPDEASCTKSTDCEGEQSCASDRSCRDECKVAGDCVDAQLCVEAHCADPPELDPDGSLPDPPASGAGGAGSGGTGPRGEGSGGTPTTGVAGADGAGGAPVEGCPLGTGECDDDPTTVCEANINLKTQCGGCGIACDAAHASGVNCIDEKCVVPPGSCEVGYADCDEDGQNGCEAPVSTDAANCGACKRKCEAGSTCTGGSCSASVIVDHATTNLDTDPEHYWITGDKIFILLTDGLHIADRNPASAPATTSLVPFTSGFGLTGDASYVYWVVDSSVDTLNRYRIDGTDPTPDLVDADFGADSPRSLTLVGNSFYFNGYTKILTAPKAGGTPTDVFIGRGFSGYRSSLQVNSANTWLAWVDPYGPAGGTPHHAYTGKTSGGTITDLGSVGSWNYVRMRVDATHFYWNVYLSTTGSIMRHQIGAAAGTAEPIATNLNLPTFCEIDAEYAYYLIYTKLYRVKKDGTQLPELVSDVPGASKVIHVDDDYVWLTASQNIVRVAK